MLQDYLRPGVAIALPFLGGFAGSTVTKNNIKSWYAGLNKPFFTPPNWLFAPMWSTLYACMGYASYVVWKEGGGFGGEAQLPLALYGGQLALNWAWTPLFFGAHKMGLAFVEISALWVSIALTANHFYNIEPTAGYLMLPYLAWVTLATALNGSIWWLNRQGNKSD